MSKLVLSNGATFEGKSPFWCGSCSGEVVFSTGMTGYVGSLTDPSYRGQILTFTYPLMGNYGVLDDRSWESEKVHPVGVVVSQACQNWSHHLGLRSLAEWLESQGVPLICEVDTRALTKLLRSSGVMLGAIYKEEVPELIDSNTRPLMEEVGVTEVTHYNRPDATHTIIAVDCGMKENILRILRALPLNIRRVPATYDYSDEEFDGVFLSNGPGNPALATKTAAILKKAMKKQKPIFGICMGTQLLAHAVGAQTFKLRYGHRGHNQPCREEKSGRCYITSQNHGFAVDPKTLPAEWEITFTNLNDGSIEGIAHKELPFSAVQFHPEAAPGPTDTDFLFERFYASL